MASLSERYDRFANQFSLNGAILYLLFYSFMCGLAAAFLRAAIHTSDSFYLATGFLMLAIGVGGIFHAVQVIHAVVRRLIAEV